MKRILSVLLAFAFALGISTSSFAMGQGQGPPTCPFGLANHFPTQAKGFPPPFPTGGVLEEAFMCFAVDGQNFSVPVTSAGKQFAINDVVITTPGFEVAFEDVLFDPDPLISYIITVQDLGAPSSFTFAFSTPLIPVIDGPNTVSGDITTNVFDFGGGGTVSLTPGSTNFAVSSVSADGGTTLQNMGVDVGIGIGTDTPGPQAGPVPLPGLPWEYMETIVTFDMGGGGDYAFVSGNTTIETIPNPEPGTLLLLGSGLAGFGIVGRWKKYRGSKV